jgi:LuxR family maltose regulon positive regulatory protein
MALAISHQMAGDSNSAFSVVFEALKEQKVRKTIFHARLLIALCHIQLAEGDLKGLQQTAGQQLKIGRELDLPESIAYANVFLGVSYYLRNDLTSAEKNLDAVIRDIGKTSILNFSHSVFGLALTYQAQGRPDEALKTAKLLVSYSLDTSNPFLLQTAQAFQAELALRQGHISEVGKWAENYDTDPFRATFRFYVPQLTKVKILFAQETTESLQQTSELLSRLHDFFVHIHTTRFLIDVLALQALVDDARGEESDSFEKLMESLNLAEPGGFIRPFLDLGPKMANLLNRLAKENPDLKYAERILVAFSNEESGTGRDVSDDQSVQRSSLSNQALVEPLTNRELEIIDLLAQRMSNKEIAEKLFISPETVKRHTINIYQKLGVNSRREAVDKAHSLGLLGEK